VALRLLELLRAAAGGRLSPVFGPLEARVLEALWRRGAPGTVRDLGDEFPTVAYTTLMTTLDRLHRKGALDRERSGRAFLYRARYSREELEARLAAEALGAIFERRPAAIRPALSFFLEALSRDDRLLDELERLVREKREREGRRRP
jgi:predicted transcriptional regulator